MKKNIKILIILLAVIINMLIVCNVKAFNIPEIKPDNPGDAGNTVNNLGGKIAGAMSIIAASIATAVLLWLSIKYMTAAPSEKADIKKSASIYIIGVILLFTVSGVLGVITTFVKGLLPSN